MDQADKRGFLARVAPALLLAFLAPLLAEVLPGATRLRALFIFPIEMCVWGIGAVLIREIVRRRGLGWPSLLLLGLILALAEECLIQQTSLAPLVIQIKGEVYARAFGVNYVYLLWALAYEAVYVVLLPVLLAELLFPARRHEGWLSRGGLIVSLVLFAIGCALAWFSWTRMARVHVFHQPIYDPPLLALALALAAMALLAWLALGPARKWRARALPVPPLGLLAFLGGLWAVLWYTLCLLAFGIAPRFPPATAVGGGLLVSLVALALLPRFAAHPGWGDRQRHALLLGTMTGSMGVSFIGFLHSIDVDFWFKVAVDLAALAWLVWLGVRLRRPAEASAPPRS